METVEGFFGVLFIVLVNLGALGFTIYVKVKQAQHENALERQKKQKKQSKVSKPVVIFVDNKTGEIVGAGEAFV